MKKIISLLFCLAIVFSLTACQTELHEHMIIQGFGIDKDGEDYTVYVRYANLDEENSEEVLVVTGETVYDALNSISLTSGKTPLYSSAMYVVYGKEVAQEGLDTALDFFIRYFKAKPVMRLFVAENTAEEILNATKNDELISSSIIEDSVSNKDNIGKTVSATVMSFISDMKSESNASILPVISLENEELSCKTSAVFSDYKYIDSLNEDETKGYLALTGELALTSIVVEMEEKISLELQNVAVTMSTEILENTVIFNIKLETTTALTAVPFSINDLNFDELESLVADEIEVLCEMAIEKLQNTNVDFYGFGNNLYLTEKEFWQENSDRFASKLSEIIINISVKSEVIRTGEENNLNV